MRGAGERSERETKEIQLKFCSKFLHEIRFIDHLLFDVISERNAQLKSLSAGDVEKRQRAELK